MIFSKTRVTKTALLFGMLAVAAMAEDVADIAAGQALYAQHCATCHGLDGVGNGPMAPILLVQPKDLTQLRADNGGVFPLERVAKRIDGRDPLVSHGSQMPVYGDLFDAVDMVPLKTDAGQPVLMAPLVADLVVYLQSLQDGS